MEGEVVSCALGGQCLAAVEPETGQVRGAVKRLHDGPEQGHHLAIVHEEQGMLRGEQGWSPSFWLKGPQGLTQNPKLAGFEKS